MWSPNKSMWQSQRGTILIKHITLVKEAPQRAPNVYLLLTMLQMSQKAVREHLPGQSAKLLAVRGQGECKWVPRTNTKQKHVRDNPVCQLRGVPRGNRSRKEEQRSKCKPSQGHQKRGNSSQLERSVTGKKISISGSLNQTRGRGAFSGVKHGKGLEKEKQEVIWPWRGKFTVASEVKWFLGR